MAYTSKHTGNDIDNAVDQTLTNKNDIFSLRVAITENAKNVNILTTDVSDIKTKQIKELSDALNQKTNKSELTSISQELSNRLDVHDTYISELQHKVDQSDIAMQGKVDELVNNSLLNINNSINAVSKQTSNNSLNIQNLSSVMNQLQANIDTDIESIEGDITKINSELKSHYGNYDDLVFRLENVEIGKVSTNDFESLQKSVEGNTETIQSISDNYVSSDTLYAALSSYVTNEDFETEAQNFITQSEKSDFVTQDEVSNFITQENLSNELQKYVILENYSAKITELENTIQGLIARIESLEKEK